jgi:hypothetical protein
VEGEEQGLEDGDRYFGVLEPGLLGSLEGCGDAIRVGHFPVGVLAKWGASLPGFGR